jgi:hypothetical protein
LFLAILSLPFLAQGSHDRPDHFQCAYYQSPFRDHLTTKAKLRVNGTQHRRTRDTWRLSFIRDLLFRLWVVLCRSHWRRSIARLFKRCYVAQECKAHRKRSQRYLERGECHKVLLATVEAIRESRSNAGLPTLVVLGAFPVCFAFLCNIATFEAVARRTL